jgi:YjbE family integral membrane protein
MESDLMSQLVAFVQVIFIDLVLAGDNAIVVGMAAASVPVEQRRKVIVWGTAAAVVLRIAFALVTTQLLQIIGLTLAGGLLLAFVAYQMYRELRTHGRDEVTPEQAEKGVSAERPKTVAAAVWQVAMADLSMSLDNVLAVAGAAKDHLEILVAGLVISIIMMALAANLIAKLIHKHRWLAWVGLAVIAYVALEMIVRGGFQVAAAVA